MESSPHCFAIQLRFQATPTGLGEEISSHGCPAKPTRSTARLISYCLLYDGPMTNKPAALWIKCPACKRKFNWTWWERKKKESCPECSAPYSVDQMHAAATAKRSKGSTAAT